MYLFKKHKAAQDVDVDPRPWTMTTGVWLMVIVNKALNCVAVLLAIILFAGLYDVGHFGLREMLSSLAIVPIVLFAICSTVPIFLNFGSSKGEVLDEEGLSAKIDEVRSRTASRITELQSTLDGLSAQDNEALVEENMTLKEQLEAIQRAERDKVLNNAEELRLRNEELENQIKHWAIQTVGEAIAEDRDGQAKAA